MDKKAFPKHCFSFPARSRSYKTIFMLNSTEHEIATAHKKLKYRQRMKFIALSLSDVVFILLINVKMPTININMPIIAGKFHVDTTHTTQTITPDQTQFPGIVYVHIKF